MRLGTAIRDLQRGMTYYPEVARVCGGVCPAVLFCCLAWKDKDLIWESDDGMERKVGKSMESLYRDTGLTEREMRGARELLERLGLISCSYLRLEHTLEFTISFHRMNELCEDFEKRHAEASVKTSDAHLSKRQMSPDKTSDGDLTKRQIDHCTEKKEENKSENGLVSVSSPQPGEGFSEKTIVPNYDFAVFWSWVPTIRKTRGVEKEARKIWNDAQFSAEERFRIVEYEKFMSQSEDWTKDGGMYSHGPVRTLEKRPWNTFEAPPCWAEQCGRVRRYFLAKTGQAASANKMTPVRLAMLSKRFEEALEMAPVKDYETAIDLMKDAIDACCESQFYHKKLDSITLEAVFFTAEKFEKYAKCEPKEAAI